MWDMESIARFHETTHSRIVQPKIGIGQNLQFHSSYASDSSSNDISIFIKIKYQ